MPWQSGGDGDRPNPWGGGQGGGGNRGGGQGEPPNIDDMIRKTQDRLKQGLPGGRGGIFLFILVAIGLWLASGFYKVETNEQAVILRFGEFVQQRGPGLNWHMPYPIETVLIRGVTDQNTVEIGNAQVRRNRRGQQQIIGRDESQMLTGDENIVDVKFNVVWRIRDLGDYLFKLRDPQGTVRAVSESVMRELVGKNQINKIITQDRVTLQIEALEKIQTVLDRYESGISILRVQISDAQPPSEVSDAFLDVQRAEADQAKFINEARAYANRIVPEARGEASRMRQQAEAYRRSAVAKAQGEASRFTAVYNEYRQAKSVTRRRIYLETMEEILSGMDKIILDGEAGSGVVPYLPLNELNRKGGNK